MYITCIIFNSACPWQILIFITIYLFGNCLQIIKLHRNANIENFVYWPKTGIFKFLKKKESSIYCWILKHNGKMNRVVIRTMKLFSLRDLC